MSLSNSGSFRPYDVWWVNRRMRSHPPVSPQAISSATTSAWRSQPVFARTPRTWVRTVVSETPPSVAMASTVLPESERASDGDGHLA